MSGLNLIIGGMGGSKEGYGPFRRALQKETGRRTIVVQSQRFGEPKTARKGAYPDALDRQARHVEDVLSKTSYEGELYIYTHSMGTPIGLIFAKEYRGNHRIFKMVVIAPANLYAEGFSALGRRIAEKVENDFGTAAGRNYWEHALTAYFVNPFRSWEEGHEVSELPVSGDLMKELLRQGITLQVGVSPDDDVFPSQLVRQALSSKGIGYFMLSEGGRHSPDYRPNVLIGDLRRNNAL